MIMNSTAGVIQQKIINSWLLILILLSGTANPAVAQSQGPVAGDWRYIGGDAAHTRYSPLDQVDASNFEDLAIAWICLLYTSPRPRDATLYRMTSSA